MINGNKPEIFYKKFKQNYPSKLSPLAKINLTTDCRIDSKNILPLISPSNLDDLRIKQ